MARRSQPVNGKLSFFGLKLADLALARACAGGSERAWERFVFLYREPLRRAAIAMTGSESLGGDLADALYAELYGLTARDGERRSPLDSYKGRGSLLAWLRTTLAQRHVDRHRRTFREQPLDTAVFDPPAREPAPEPQARELAQLAASVAQVLDRRTAAERFLLSAYFLDGRTLASIGRALGVHEATVSRHSRRLLDEIRKDLLRALEATGLSKRAAREALGADPRDLELNLTKVLQSSQLSTFPEKAAK